MRRIGDQLALRVDELPLALGVQVDRVDQWCRLPRHHAGVDRCQVLRWPGLDFAVYAPQRIESVPPAEHDQQRRCGNQCELG